MTADKIIQTMVSWIGTDKRKIIDIYNSHEPLAKGYKVKYTDAWCDATVSAAFIVNDAVDLIGATECGVERHIYEFKKIGIWIEDGSIVPKPGDIICYSGHVAIYIGNERVIHAPHTGDIVKEATVYLKDIIAIRRYW